MDLDDFYGGLLRPELPQPEPLLRAAFAATSAGIEATQAALRVQHLLAKHPDTPADLLTALTVHRNAHVRATALANPHLPTDVRDDAIRHETSQDTLSLLEATNPDQDALELIAARVPHLCLQGLAPRMLINRVTQDVPPEVAAAFVRAVVTDPAVTDAFARDDGLADQFADALVTAGLAEEILPSLTRGPALLTAALPKCQLSKAAWSKVEENIRPLLSKTSPATDRDAVDLLAALLWCPSAPVTLRQALRERLYVSHPEHALVQAAHVAPDVNLLEVADLVRLAGQLDADAIEALVQAPLPDEVLVALTRNPRCPNEVVTHVFSYRVDVRDEQSRAAAVAAAKFLDGQAQLVVVLGPDALEHVTFDRDTVLVDVLNRRGRSSLWAPYAMTLGERARLELKWSTAWGLAQEDVPLSSWLTGLVGQALTAPGAGRLFNELAATFPGTVGGLVDVLTGVTAPATP